MTGPLQSESVLREEFPVLVFLTGEQSGCCVVLDQAVMTGGRQGDNEIAIADSGLSRRHFQIFREGKAFYVRDIGSTNGTFLNQHRLEGEMVLVNDDIITAGHSALRFVQGAQALAELRTLQQSHP
jgi:pSer/pThr/pTyr-binding forkhead associated (FHA) protein